METFNEDVNYGKFIIHNSDNVMEMRIEQVNVPNTKKVCSYTQYYYYDAEDNIVLLYPKFNENQYAKIFNQ